MINIALLVRFCDLQRILIHTQSHNGISFIIINYLFNWNIPLLLADS